MAKFFSYAERISLQKFLAEGLSFKEIGRTLGKDPSTISREVRKHMSEVATGRPGYPFNPCKHRKTCRYLCSSTKVFYCDAGKPYQKGAIEVNHELIRRVLTDVNGRNRSFNDLTQEDVTLMMNHINSYKRKKLNDRSPYETFSFYHGKRVLKLLGCSEVPADDILLKPELLGI